jgi:hypothetical protein
MPTRSFLGHLEALRQALEATREYVRTNAEAFPKTASPGTMARTDRTISKIQGEMANLDSELNSVSYQINCTLRPE